jgi:hypothetical protein
MFANFAGPTVTHERDSGIQGLGFDCLYLLMSRTSLIFPMVF